MQRQIINGVRSEAKAAANKKNAIGVVFGATGATGRKVVSKLQESNTFEKIYIVGRRKVSEEDFEKYFGNGNKIEGQIVAKDLSNFADLQSSYLETIKENQPNTFFNCLGTTRGQAGGADAFYKVEHDISSTLAKLAQEQKIKHVFLVSAQGANANVPKVKFFHPLWYAHTLGMKEETVLTEHNINTVSIFRPGMLNRLEAAKERFMEKVILKIGILDSLRVDNLANAIVKDAEIVLQSEDEPSTYIYEGNKLIREFANVQTNDEL